MQYNQRLHAYFPLVVVFLLSLLHISLAAPLAIPRHALEARERHTPTVTALTAYFEERIGAERMDPTKFAF